MGNGQSSPPPQPTPPPPPPAPVLVPPLPPPCDLKCQKQKDLALLKKNLDSIDPEQDPIGYEKARIAYFTLLNGPGWLAQEKSRIAKEEVEPVTSGYLTKFNALKGEQQSQQIFENLADALRAQEMADEKENTYLEKQLMIQQDKAAVSNRLAELNAGTPYTTSAPTPSGSSQWISWAVDIVIALLALFVLYKAYTRFFGNAKVSPTSPDLTST